MYLKIKNNGLIEEEALTLLGASVKDESKIGRFGSGNKFALAYLLRNNYNIFIYSGTNRIDIVTKKSIFRDQEFDVIYINNIKTSITTEFGKDWKLWQAVREIYSNAIDEGGHDMEICEFPEPKENETHFYIEMTEDLISFYDRFDHYFSFRRTPVYENDYGKIYAHTGNSINLYRRGIRCYDAEEPSIFDYDLPGLTINESRIVESPWRIQDYIWDLITTCTNKDIIKAWFDKISTFDGTVRNYIESSPYMYSRLSKRYSFEFLDVIMHGKYLPDGAQALLDEDEMGFWQFIPRLYYKTIKEHLTKFPRAMRNSDENFYKEIHDNELQMLLDEAKANLIMAKFLVPYPIKLVRFTDDAMLGLALMKEKTILVADKACKNGIQTILETIIEEYIHITFNVNDLSRAFQNASIRLFIDYMRPNWEKKIEI